METEQKELIGNFEDMKNRAELQALSNLSLEQPLNNKQYNRMMELAKKLNIR